MSVSLNNRGWEKKNRLDPFIRRDTVSITRVREELTDHRIWLPARSLSQKTLPVEVKLPFLLDSLPAPRPSERLVAANKDSARRRAQGEQLFCSE